MNTKNNNSLIALFAGALVGLGFGILFAPDKGTKTREKIKDKIDDLKEEAQEKFSSKKDNVKESIDELISNSSHKVEETISYLEEKLADLKKQNNKFQK